MARPRLLDLFCGGGGAAMGYHRAGFDVVGVDLYEQPKYPFKFVQADAMTFPLRGFDAFHASPPCKMHTVMKHFSFPEHVDFLKSTQDLFKRLKRPWVIENVPGSPMLDPVILCGSMFGLAVRRHRLFDSNIILQQPECRHVEQDAGPQFPTARYHLGKEIRWTAVVGVYGGGQCGGPGEFQRQKEAMGIDWLDRGALTQAIPPAYTELIGRQLMAALEGRA